MCGVGTVDRPATARRILWSHKTSNLFLRHLFRKASIYSDALTNRKEHGADPSRLALNHSIDIHQGEPA